MYFLPVMMQRPQTRPLSRFFKSYRRRRAKAPVFWGQKFCALKRSVYHFRQAMQPYIWHCAILLCGGLASAAATEHRAHRHRCTTLIARADNTKTRKKETRTENDEVAAASVAGGGLKPKLCQYLVMAATYPINSGCDAREHNEC